MSEIGSVDRTLLPADILQAPDEDQKKYAAAQQFEQMLVQQMMEHATSIADSDEQSGDDEEASAFGSDSASSYYRDMLPELMAKAMVQGDGTGIARDLYDAMADKSTAAVDRKSGGTSAA